MTTQLVRKTTCLLCEEDVEISYTAQEFENRFKKLYDTDPSFNSIQQQLYGKDVCQPCIKSAKEKEPSLHELNNDYWKNHNLSNPNE